MQLWRVQFDGYNKFSSRQCIPSDDPRSIDTFCTYNSIIPDALDSMISDEVVMHF